MNIYFSCSLTGGRQDETIYGQIVDHLLSSGHDVPTAHLARPEILLTDKTVTAEEIYARDIAWLEGCDVVIAEVSTPSHGVGYEIAYALGIGKPVLCLHRGDRKVSKMLSGNHAHGIQLASYHELNTIHKLIDNFLRNQ